MLDMFGVMWTKGGLVPAVLPVYRKVVRDFVLVSPIPCFLLSKSRIYYW